jgi:hypothetical protein
VNVSDTHRPGVGDAEPKAEELRIQEPRSSNESPQSKQGSIIVAPFVRVERERDGEGWIVIAANGHGWLHGDRPKALRDKRWLDRQWGRV